MSQNVGGIQMGQIYGYVRVSSRDQNEARQMAAMREAGVSDADIYLDKRSGADFERQGYRRLLRKIRAGDTLVVKSIDRLGRNYDEILEQWRFITREKCAFILVLDMPLLDIRQSRDLTGTLIADIVLQLLSYVAQTEREFIRQRQAEGIAAAKARGVHFGRLAMPVPENFPEVFMEWSKKELSSRTAGKKLGVSQTTFLKWVKLWGQTNGIETICCETPDKKVQENCK